MLLYWETKAKGWKLPIDREPGLCCWRRSASKLFYSECSWVNVLQLKVTPKHSVLFLVTTWARSISHERVSFVIDSSFQCWWIRTLRCWISLQSERIYFRHRGGARVRLDILGQWQTMLGYWLCFQLWSALGQEPLLVFGSFHQVQVFLLVLLILFYFFFTYLLISSNLTSAQMYSRVQRHDGRIPWHEFKVKTVCRVRTHGHKTEVELIPHMCGAEIAKRDLTNVMLVGHEAVVGQDGSEDQYTPHQGFILNLILNQTGTKSLSDVMLIV